MIDILMATYNGMPFLAEQLESIEQQTRKDWRLIVHDDGSTDGTWEILEVFQKQLGDKKMVIKRNNPPCGSAKGNFLGLLQTSDSDYAMCCDQDDVWHRDKIERTMYRMRQMEQCFGKEVPLLVHTDLRVVDASLKQFHPSFHRYMNLYTDGKLCHVLVQNQVTGCTVMVNKPLREQMKIVKSAEQMVMHDQWMALIGIVFGHISYLDRPTIDYRQHGDNAVGAQNAKSMAYMWKRFQRGKGKFRKDMKDSANQARSFIQIYASCITDKKMIILLNNYAFLYKKNKFLRIFSFIRYGFLKKGIVRKMMQMIWG